MVGVLTVLADTDDDAYVWGERLFERYRAEAERIV